MKGIYIDLEKCTGCKNCEIYCAVEHSIGKNVFAAALESPHPVRRISVECSDTASIPLQCRHCDDAPCAKVCPSGALTRENAAEPVVVKQEKCIGCAFCVQACPFGVIVLAQRSGPEGGRVVIKCDHCTRRLAEGLEPACVSACPVGALAFEEADRGSRRARRLTAARAAAARR